mgnify:CR=1 FL=1
MLQGKGKILGVKVVLVEKPNGKSEKWIKLFTILNNKTANLDEYRYFFVLDPANFFIAKPHDWEEVYGASIKQYILSQAEGNFKKKGSAAQLNLLVSMSTSSFAC